LRASTLLPTIFTLSGMQLQAKGVTAGIVSALVVGLPIFAYGNIYNIAGFKTVGSLLTVLLSGIIAMVISRLRGAAHE
ncbi:hypothetical protein, partial [Pseudomonas aeruginosa]